MNEQLLNYFKGDELAATAWKNKYAFRTEEIPKEMHVRMAYSYANAEIKNISKDIIDNFETIKENLSDYGKDRFEVIIENVGDSNWLAHEVFFHMLQEFKYIIPGGSIMANLGTNTPTSLSNCYVLPSPEDNIESIFDTSRDAAQLYKRRGGVGIDISKLRPSGSAVNNASKTSTGSVSFMTLYSEVTKLIGQSGRRGALMLSIDVNHPDILEFIKIKQDLTKVTGANVSVKTNAEFMKAVEKDDFFMLKYPTDLVLPHEDENFTVSVNQLMTDGQGKYWKKVRAKQIWEALIEAAHKSAEPGILFWDNHLDQDPAAVYDKYRPIGTNPCGEIPLQGLDSCRLSAVNLYSLVENPFTKDSFLNLDIAYAIFYEQLVMSDNLVDLESEALGRILNKIGDSNTEEYQLWESILAMGQASRRVGNGFTGLADMFAALNVRYGSEESLRGFSDLMLVKLRAEIDATVDLAILRGTFEGFDNSKEYDLVDGNLVGKNKFYKYIADVYPEGVQRMYKFGRRNVSFSTVAPTGTVSLMGQVSSGIEPLFQPYYIRRMKVVNAEDGNYTDVDGQVFKEYIVVHPKLQVFAEVNKCVKDETMSDKDYWAKVYKESPYYRCTAEVIDWRDRLSMQYVAQRKTTHSISSTLNLAENTTKEEVNQIYLEAYKKGLKGITVYRDGSRGGILVSDNKPKTEFAELRAPKRPKSLKADLYTIVQSGTKYVVIVGLMDNRPYEIFAYEIPKDLKIDSKNGEIIKVSKGHYMYKSDNYSCENVHNSNDNNIEKKAAALYVSMLLRHRANIKFIIKTAKKVDDNIASFTSAMCRVLSKYIPKEVSEGEVCPDCGGKMVHEAGCEKCLDCSYSKCMMIHGSIA